MPNHHWALYFNLDRICDDDAKMDADWFLEKDKVKECLTGNLIKRFVCGYEQGDLEKRSHYQIYLETPKLKNKDQILKWCKLVAEGLKFRKIPVCQWGLRPGHSATALEEYCSKEHKRPILTSDGFVHAERLEDDILGQEKMFPWQRYIYEYFRNSDSNRSILWVYSTVGCLGKTKLGRYCAFHMKGRLLGYGSSGGLLHLVAKAPNTRTWIVNLPRAKPKEIGGQDIYSTLEAMKDQCFSDPKYDGVSVFRSRKGFRVMVLANFPPANDYNKDGRYEVYEVVDSATLIKRTNGWETRIEVPPQADTPSG